MSLHEILWARGRIRLYLGQHQGMDLAWRGRTIMGISLQDMDWTCWRGVFDT